MKKSISFYSLLVVSIVLISSCSSDDALTPNASFTGSQQNNDNNGGGSNQVFNPDTDFYFQGDVDGNTADYVEGTEGYLSYSLYAESPGVGGETNVVTFSGLADENDLLNGTSIKPALGVEFVVVLNSVPVDGESYRSKLGEGSLDYGNAVTASGPMEGAVVRYFDTNEVEWKTNFGTGDQTGSTFEITEFTPTQDSFGDEVMTIRANFDCTLYDDNGNDLKASGTIRANFAAN